MNTQDFNKIVDSRIDKIRAVLASKGKEYAKEDRFYNIKRAAEASHCTVTEAWRGMWMKHLVSVMDLVEGTLDATEYMIDEKIGDCINYLILLEGILRERLPAAEVHARLANKLGLKHSDCKHFYENPRADLAECAICRDFSRYELKVDA